MTGSIPDDLAVIGFDNQILSQITEPGIMGRQLNSQSMRWPEKLST